MANNNNFAEKIFHGPFKCYLKAKQVSRFAQLIQNIYFWRLHSLKL